MKNSFLFLLLPILVQGIVVPEVPAASANFQANCAPAPVFGCPSGTFCWFDTTRTPAGQTGTSCAPSTVNLYFWNPESTPSSDDFWTSQSATFYCYSGPYCDFVTLDVACNNGMSAQKTHCLCTTIGITGCIIPGAGWTP